MQETEVKQSVFAGWEHTLDQKLGNNQKELQKMLDSRSSQGWELVGVTASGLMTLLFWKRPKYR